MLRRRRVILAGLAAFLTTIGILATGSVGNSTLAPEHFSEALNRFIVPYSPERPAAAREMTSWMQKMGMDIAGVNWQRGEIEVIVTDRELSQIRARGIEGRVIERRMPGDRAGGPDSRYLNPEKVEARLKQLHQEFPNHTRLEEIGRSIQGRPVWAILISDTPARRDLRSLEKPSIIFDGMHHAREVMTSEVVLDVAESLLKGARAGSRMARDFVSGWNVWVVPMLNVDGNDIVWKKNNMWRKNARADGSSVHGVDLNRNYPYRWGGCNGSSGSKSSDTYRGQEASSEPEVSGLVKLAEKVRPAASLSYHSYSELVLYPYGCQGDVTGENQLVERVAKELASKLPTDSSSSKFYRPGTPWQLLYAVDGSSMDFMFAAYGALSFTFEINQAFQPSYELREPTLKKHRVAWRYFLDRISNNLLSVKVVDSATGKPARARIALSTIQHQKGERAFETNPAGNYFKVLDPGRYSLKAKLEDGREGKADVEMSGKPQQITINVPSR